MKKIIFLLLIISLCSYIYPMDLKNFIEKSFIGENTVEQSNVTLEVLKEIPEIKSKINGCCHPYGTPSPIVLGGKEYTRGLSVQANNEIRLIFQKPVVKFTAIGGIDSRQINTPASARAWIKAGNKEVFKTNIIKADNSVVNIDLKLNNAKTIDLCVDDAGDGITCDQWDWSNAKFTYSDGSSIYLDEIAVQSQYKYRFPFSFVYNNISSDNFLKSWKINEQTQQINDSTDLITFIYTDPKTNLELKAEIKYYKDIPAADWTLYFTNKGTENSQVISAINSLETETINPSFPLYVPANNKPDTLIFNSIDDNNDKPVNISIYNMRGSLGAVKYNLNEFKITKRELYRNKEIELKQIGLMPSFDEFSPYWTIAYPNKGMSVGLGWTASWNAKFISDGNTTRMTAGIPKETINTYLKPNETIRSPRILIVPYESATIETGYNKFRQTMIKHIIPQENNKPKFIPMAFSQAWSENSTTTEQTDKEYIRPILNAGFEVGWFDAWYTRDGFPAGMGNYHIPVSDIPDPKRFPNGLKPLIDLYKSSGMDIMVWFAPEQVCENTFIAKEKPEYVMNYDNSNSGSYALVNPEGRKYLTDIFNQAIKEWDIKVFRTDASTNLDVLKKYVNETAQDRRGIAENKYVQALYTFWDDLLKSNPGLIIDNCSGGGTRLDLELMNRSLSLWRSDSNCWILTDKYATAILNQLITSNLNNYIPWTTGGALGTNPYFIRSAFNTGLSYIDNTKPTDFNINELKQGIAEGKRLRKYMTGNFYSLFNYDNSPFTWCAWQYHRSKEKDGYLIAFRREKSSHFGININLQEINADKYYKIKIYNSYELSDSQIVKGNKLKNYTTYINTMPGSILIEYKEL